MGSYAYLIGNYEVSDTEKAKENILKLLYEGGMMELSHVNLFDEEIVLQKPCNDKTKFFNLNYFEDNIWETLSVNDDGSVQSGKKGGRQFSKVVCAVYLYMELISDKPCIAVEDGQLIDSNAIGWINHVLGTSYMVTDRYQNLWDKLKLTKDRQKLYSDVIKDINKFDAIDTNIYRDMMAYLYLYQNDILQEAEKGLEKTEEANNVDDAQKTLQLSSLANIVQNALAEYKTDHSYEDLIHFPFDEKENKRNDIAIGLRFFHFIPPQVYASLVAKEMDLSFDQVWNDFKEKEYPYICQLDDSEQKALYISTSEYLATPLSSINSDIKPYILTDDDRLYWNAKPGKEMGKWIDDLQKRYQEIESKMIGIEEFIGLFVRANVIYKKIYPFADMNYEFLSALNDERYQKAICLLDELIEENRKNGETIKKATYSSWDHENTGITFNEGRVKIKRYLALMANADMRKKVFGF